MPFCWLSQHLLGCCLGLLYLPLLAAPPCHGAGASPGLVVSPPTPVCLDKKTLFSRSYFPGCFKTPNMPGTTSLMRQAEEVAMAVAEKNPSARPTRSLSTSLFPLRVFQGRRNRLSPLHFLRSSQAGLTLDMLHESSRNLEKPFLPMTASFPSENLAIDPDKI